jgi:catechol 2,3-dioxygenase-like lactoylglutathione lyase family enzyme
VRRSASTFPKAAIVLILAIAAPALLRAERGEARAAAAAPTPVIAAAPLARAVVAVGLTVGDLDRSVDFFTRVLDFDKVAESEIAGDGPERLYGVFGMRARVARLRLGDEMIELTEYLAPRGRPIPPDARSNDRSFQHIAIIVSDMEAAYRRLREHRVAHASPGPQTLPDWNPAAGGIQAFYFKDPDGHALEILKFPPGKGDPKWRRAGGRLFLGIDHTAIVVSDTEASLRFYRDALGLRVAGASENHGIEQERLNNVFGARLRITALRAAAGPGIEFLEYLAPADGRPAPADLRANDLLHWHTIMKTDDPAAAAAPVRAASGRLVSPGAVPLDGGIAPPDGPETGVRSGLLVRDPDGHGILLAQTTGGAR